MKKKAIAASALATMALFGASQQAKAKAVMIPTFAVGGGWANIISFVDTEVNATTVHIAYNYKRVGATGVCLHANGNVRTSQYDLTSFIVDGSTSSPVPIYGDTVGGGFGVALGPATITQAHIGFVALETTTASNTDLVAEAITYNISQRFLFSQRSIDLNHGAFGSATVNANTTLAQQNTSVFMSFAPADSNPLIYAIGTQDSTGVNVNVFDLAGFPTVISVSKGNIAGASNLYNRRENGFSDNASISDRCVLVQPICASATAPTTGLVSYNTCFGGTDFKSEGGWFLLQNASTPTSSNIIAFKIESNPAYGWAVTPLHPLQYSTR